MKFLLSYSENKTVQFLASLKFDIVYMRCRLLGAGLSLALC